MAIHSEYTTKPTGFLICHPQHIEKLRLIQTSEINRLNFGSVPDYDVLLQEYSQLIDVLQAQEIPVIDAVDYVSPHDAKILFSSVNAMFTRDTSITLPWTPKTAIISSMSLNARRDEPRVMQRALTKLGYTDYFISPHPLEGGDVIMTELEGKRTIVVGIGKRTSMSAAHWLYNKLVRANVADQIIAVEHDRRFLHLDTSATFINDSIFVGSTQSLGTARLLKAHEQYEVLGDFCTFLKARGFHVLDVPTEDALLVEAANMLCLDNGVFVGYNIQQSVQKILLELDDSLQITNIVATEIVRANGGAHCLTRPLYI